MKELATDPVLVSRTIKKMQDVTGHFPDWEDVLAVQYRRFIEPGDTIIDVGAHLGRHLVQFNELVGPSGTLLAFEPLPFAFKELKKLGLRSTMFSKRVKLHNMALAEESGTSEFIFAEGAPGESGLKERKFNYPEMTTPTKIQVKLGRLDDYTVDLDKVSFIKIDTEGGEMGVLKGGQATLSKHRPVVSVEYGEPSYSVYGLTAESLFEFATENNYVLCDILGTPIPTLEQWKTVCDFVTWDWWMVPEEKLENWCARVAPPMSA